MKAQLWTYLGEKLVAVKPIELPGYDGDPYGDTVPFCVASNQAIVIDPDLFKEEL